MDPSSTAPATVGFLRHKFLPASETFIYTSMRSLERYRVSVFAKERLSEAKFPWDRVTALRGRRLGALEATFWEVTTWSPRFWRWARSVRIIHAHMGFEGAHALLAAKLLRLPLVVSYYGKDVTLAWSRERFWPGYWHYWGLRRPLQRAATRILALSGHMRDELVAQGCPAERIRVVHLGVNLERFDVQRAAPALRGSLHVLMVGREVDKKGFDDGLRACARARAAGVNLRVTLLGSGGDERPALERLATQLALPVDWPDPKSSVVEAMARAEVLLVPSRVARNGDQEGTPTVICEGSAARLPIVATRHAGIPEQVDDGVTGLLVAERDVDGLARALAELADDPERRAAMGRAGREKMLREFSLDAHRAALEAVYDEVLR